MRREGGVPGGTRSFIACLGHLAIDYASLPRRSFLLLLIVETPPAAGRWVAGMCLRSRGVLEGDVLEERKECNAFHYM